MPSPDELYPLVRLWVHGAGLAPQATAATALAHLLTAVLIGQSLRASVLMRTLLSPHGGPRAPGLQARGVRLGAPLALTRPPDAGAGPRRPAAGPAGNYRIQKFSPWGQPIAQWNTNQTGGDNKPGQIVVDPQGNVYVADGGGGQKFSADGRRLAAPIVDLRETTRRGKISFGAQSVAVDPQGNVYFRVDSRLTVSHSNDSFSWQMRE